MDWSKPEVILKVAELIGCTAIFGRPDNFWLMNDSGISRWGLFTIIAEFFFGNGYFWNISLEKTWWGEVCAFPVLQLAQPS